MLFLKKIMSIPLVLRISLGLLIGVILGLVLPQATFIAMLGKIFISALKGIAPILVLFLVISSLANAGKNLGARFKTVISLYLISTLIAAVVAVVASFIFPLTVTLSGSVEASAPGKLSEVFGTLLTNMVMNPIQALSIGNYVGILFWAILVGVSVRKFTDDATKSVLCDISNAISVIISWVIQAAPFGILGLSFETVS